MKIVAFSIADNANLPYFKIMAKTFKHFHPEIDLVLFDHKDCEATKDPAIFYKATPFFANRLFNKGADLVLKLDADNFILGKLDYLFNTDYDIGTVLNWNRVDPPVYGEIGIATIAPKEYFNCGLVAMKNHDFVKHWLALCYSPHFDRCRYKEQDLLNLLCYYGNYMPRCFDMYDDMRDYRAFHGLAAKGEGHRMVMRDGEVVLPKGEDGYPQEDTIIKAYHVAGGHAQDKMNHRKVFSREVAEYIDTILNEKK